MISKFSFFDTRMIMSALVARNGRRLLLSTYSMQETSIGITILNLIASVKW